MSSCVDVEVARTPRDADACDTLTELARRINSLDATLSPSAEIEALAEFSFELLLSAAVLLRRDSLDGAVPWVLTNAASDLVTSVAHRLATSEECVTALAAVAGRFPESAFDVAREVVRHARQWPAPLYESPGLLALNSSAYEGLRYMNTLRWADYLDDQLDRGHHTLSPGQVAVARVLARDWVGTGTSLFDTAPVLAP